MMKNNYRYLLFMVALLISGCGHATVVPSSSGSTQRTLTVMTHDSFSASESVITTFETENNVKVQFITSGDAGSALNKAILSKNNPIADLFYGVDNTFLSRALTEDIFERYNQQ